MVPRVGLEPTTYGLELHCSIQLSYRGTLQIRSICPRFVNQAEGCLQICEEETCEALLIFDHLIVKNSARL